LEKDIDRLREEMKGWPETIKAVEKSVLESLKERLDTQDKRISDLSIILTEGANKVAASSNAISSASNKMSSVLGLGSILLTAGLFGVGLYSVIKVTEQAKLAAEQNIKEYLRSPEAKKDFHSSVETLFSSDIAEIRDLLKKWERSRSSQYDENAIALSPTAERILLKIIDISEKQRTPDQWRVLIIARTEQKSYESALALTDNWLSQPTQTTEQTAHALALKGWVLGRAERFKEAVSTFEEVTRRFSTVSTLRELVARTLTDKGYTLWRVTPPQYDAAITAFEEVDQRFGNDPSQRKQVASALIGKGTTLGIMGKYQAAIAAYDEINRRYTADPNLHEIITVSLNNKASMLTLLQPPQNEAAIAIYDEIIRRFGTDPTLFVRENVSRALNSKARRLLNLSPPQPESALATYDEVIRRFQDDPASMLRMQVALALRDKGILLENSNNQKNQAQANYEDYLRRFANAPEPAIQEVTAQVRARLAALK
jgi:tetratricopeptide (TPR) repeat protein